MRFVQFSKALSSNVTTPSGIVILLSEVQLPKAYSLIIFNDSGKTYVAYSGSGSWCTDYCIALLELVGDDPMDPASWKKQDAPVLSKNESFKGIGHCSIVEEDKLVFFHAWPADEENIVWNTVPKITTNI